MVSIGSSLKSNNLYRPSNKVARLLMHGCRIPNNSATNPTAPPVPEAMATVVVMQMGHMIPLL